MYTTKKVRVNESQPFFSFGRPYLYLPSFPRFFLSCPSNVSAYLSGQQQQRSVAATSSKKDVVKVAPSIASGRPTDRDTQPHWAVGILNPKNILILAVVTVIEKKIIHLSPRIF